MASQRTASESEQTGPFTQHYLTLKRKIKKLTLLHDTLQCLKTKTRISLGKNTALTKPTHITFGSQTRSHNNMLSNTFIHRKCVCFTHKHYFSDLIHIHIHTLVLRSGVFVPFLGLSQALASLPDCGTVLKTTAKWVRPLDVYWY